MSPVLDWCCGLGRRRGRAWIFSLARLSFGLVNMYYNDVSVSLGIIQTTALFVFVQMNR